MLDWHKLGTDWEAISDTWNEFIIKPVVSDHIDGPWLASAHMANGDDHRPRVFESRRRAELYAEELEVSSWID